MPIRNLPDSGFAGIDAVSEDADPPPESPPELLSLLPQALTTRATHMTNSAAHNVRMALLGMGILL
jgi:hypothetical protein